MKSQIRLYRVILNILFYIFYVLLFSIAFSFIFPTVQVLLGKQVLDPNNPIFANVQIAIFILVLVFSLIFRKFFYLPIKVDLSLNDQKLEKKTENKEKKVTYNIETIVEEPKKEDKKTEEIKENKEIKIENITKEKEEENNFDKEKAIELDIKIGKEIK